MKQNLQFLYKYQRQWRRDTKSALQRFLGDVCQGCASVEGLKLYIPDRTGEDLKRFKNNTISVYTAVLKGKLPKDRIKLLCDDCRFDPKEI